MSKSYATLKEALKTKLESITGKDSNALFAGVYGINETEPEGFPTAFVVESAGEGRFLDTGRNERDWQFQLLIQQESSKKTPEEASIVIIDSVDRVISSFDKDPTLKDTNEQPQVKWIRVVPLDFDFGTGQQGAVQSAILQIVAVDIVSRNN